MYLLVLWKKYTTESGIFGLCKRVARLQAVSLLLQNPREERKQLSKHESRSASRKAASSAGAKRRVFARLPDTRALLAATPLARATRPSNIVLVFPRGF